MPSASVMMASAAAFKAIRRQLSAFGYQQSAPDRLCLLTADT